MKPYWIDDTTLQLVLSRFYYYDLRTQARRISLRRNVPVLDEALKWCAERRMAVKLATVEVDIQGNLLEAYRELEQMVDTSSISSVFDASAKHTSHRLVFKRWENAFEFKLRWC